MTDIADDYQALIFVAWRNGALAMRFRVMKLLNSMGEHELAAQVAMMDVPLRADIEAKVQPAPVATTSEGL